jgi:hypothetical protein
MNRLPTSVTVTLSKPLSIGHPRPLRAEMVETIQSSRPLELTG